MSKLSEIEAADKEWEISSGEPPSQLGPDRRYLLGLVRDARPLIDQDLCGDLRCKRCIPRRALLARLEEE